MTTKQTTRHLFTILLTLLLGTLTSAPLVRAQKPAETKASSPSGQKEGIKVHGQWTIDIRSPDGKLVTHREFKNELFNSGATLLADFLQRSAKAGEWEISVGEPTGTSFSDTRPCGLVGITPSDCLMVEPFSNRSGSNLFKTLTISSGTGNGNSRTTVLSGTATAQRDGVIRGVNTRLSSCPVEATGVCSSSSFPVFTSRALGLSERVNVVVGQIIQVKVVISFS